MCLIFDEESKNRSLVGVLWLQTRNALIKKCPYTVNFCPYKRDLLAKKQSGRLTHTQDPKITKAQKYLSPGIAFLPTPDHHQKCWTTPLKHTATA